MPQASSSPVKGAGRQFWLVGPQFHFHLSPYISKDMKIEAILRQKQKECLKKTTNEFESTSCKQSY
jgi:hypothetical protein